MKLRSRNIREGGLAQAALDRGQADLSRAEQKQLRATEIAAELRKLRQENHFSPRIRAVYEGKKR